MPGSSNWDRLADLLAEAAAIPPEQREQFLSRNTEDPMLRSEVLSLLAVNPPSCDILEGPVLDWYRPQRGFSEPEAPLPRLLPGEMLACRFRVGAFLGRGGMGEVYAADDIELSERVALKLLNPDLAALPKFLERFRREIRLARRISHPNVARVFDFA